MSKKKQLGQFFTKKDVWLLPHIKDFIIESKCKIAYDPFAGEGDLLKIHNKYSIKKVIGLDIDKNLSWKINDSLLKIPHVENAIIITNPPYLAKQSASRRKIDTSKYFNTSKYDDLYLIALEKMIEAQKYVVAIIPESFINSNFINKNLLHSITVLEENPFADTEVPVCVVCFDGEIKDLNKVKVYKNEIIAKSLKEIYDFRIQPKNNYSIKFNDIEGWLALKAVDGIKKDSSIKFDYKKNVEYDWTTRLKVSSRHITLININLVKEKRELLLEKANLILNNIRENSMDLVLTPFMGNTKENKRRRRMDFRLARAILEKALEDINYKESNLFNYEDIL